MRPGGLPISFHGAGYVTRGRQCSQPYPIGQVVQMQTRTADRIVPRGPVGKLRLAQLQMPLFYSVFMSSATALTGGSAGLRDRPLIYQRL